MENEIENEIRKNRKNEKRKTNGGGPAWARTLKRNAVRELLIIRYIIYIYNI